MVYIDGYGYVDNSIQYTLAVGKKEDTRVSNTTDGIAAGSFDDILKAEEANLDRTSTDYNLNDIFSEAAKKYNVSEDLLKAVAYNESRFQADATSSAGAMGIMQLMPATAEYLGVQDAYNPYDNIMGGARLLSRLSDMYDGNERLMIAAYNAGSGNVEKYGGVPPFKETQNYVEKVLDTLKNGVSTDGITVSAGKENVVNTAQGAKANTNNVVRTENTGNDSSKSYISDEVLTYDEYKLLMTYFEQMLKIISNMGDASVSGNEKEASLTDYFRPGGGSVVYNKATINLL